MTWDTILEWVQTNVVESEDLDFKASFWPTKDQKSRSVEIAKDLAAMMNHVGGAVVVGLKDEGDRCAGFSGMPLPRQAESIIRQAAGRHIVPSEAASGVHITPLRGHDSTGNEQVVLLVEVEAWPHGPVAVRNLDGLYRLPVRRGSQTEDLAWEEAMRRFDAGHRRMWLRFTDWQRAAAGKPLDVRIQSPIRVDLDGRRFTVDGQHNRVFRLDRLALDSLSLRCEQDPNLHWIDQQISLGWSPSRPRSVSVPLDVLRAAWMEDDLVQVLLDVTLTFNGTNWSLSTYGTH